MMRAKSLAVDLVFTIARNLRIDAIAASCRPEVDAAELAPRTGSGRQTWKHGPHR